MIIHEFGFINYKAMFCSILRPHDAFNLLMFSSIATWLSCVTGIDTVPLFLLFALIIFDLPVGLYSSYYRSKQKKRKKWFNIRKFYAWFIKLFINFFFLALVNAFQNAELAEATTVNNLSAEYYFYHYLHSAIVFFIMGVYTLGIKENFEGVGIKIPVLQFISTKFLKKAEDAK